MNELIKITYDGDKPLVSARDLHEFLEVETPYHKWFPRMAEYGFVEGTDFSVTDIFVRNPNGGPQNLKDAALTIEMAKEICMLQRNERGKEARQYFIQLEKDWNSPEKVMARALRIAEEELSTLRVEYKALERDNSRLSTDLAAAQPKADYFDELVDRNLLTNFRETAKQLQLGEREFIHFLIEHKYLFRDKRGKLLPYNDKNDGLFEVKECFNEKTQWSGTQTLVTPKGRETFRLLYAMAS